jgi:anti-sigma regulatory factor (Ser/Thr protein kinase)
MEIALTELVAVTDPSSVGQVRRLALSTAQRLGLDETRAGEMALLATEVSRNVLVHGGGGEVIITGFKHNDKALGRILALDRGPGIPDVAKAMEDGFSTNGTPGGGLGAMKRIASELEIFTARTGTVVLVEVGDDPHADGLQIAGMAVPYPGEQVCGDAWAYHNSPERMLTMIADGLGHGLAAAEAAQEAIATFHARIECTPSEILSYIHDALRKTRGAVAGIAEIRPQERSITFAGVGNIAAVLLSAAKSQSFVSHNGTLGSIASRIQTFHFEWKPDSILILHSDGLQSRWDLSNYAGLLSRHPAIIGGTLLRDFRRQRDDASVVVVKAA